MVSRVQEHALPNGPTVRLKVFSITEEGRAPIAELVAHVARMKLT
jgi:hypothetical protein